MLTLDRRSAGLNVFFLDRYVLVDFVRSVSGELVAGDGLQRLRERAREPFSR